MNRLLYFIIVISMFIGCTETKSGSDFVQVDGNHFTLKGESYAFAGTNFWYGAYLGQPGEAGNRERLRAELDLMKAQGVTNLRILGSSEESEFGNTLAPVFIRQDGSYNEDLLVGLDYLLSEMSKRDMKAVIFLTNYWEWSGGMNILNGWYGEGLTVDPGEGDWVAFMNNSAQFYQNEEAQEAFREYIKSLVTRTNTVTERPYFNDPTIMSWQLANEPRPGSLEVSDEAIPVYIDWIDETAGFIKSLAPHQLVSSGSEGEVGSLLSMKLFVDAHRTPNIDYLTFHMWAKNWRWLDPSDMAGTYDQAVDSAKQYVEEHVSIADSLGKPIVMEEFGFPRDDEEFSPDSPTSYRDKYYKMVYDLVEKHPVLAGTNFWSWGGFGEAQHEDYWWKEGDPFTGDPPFEPQGLNSVFAGDASTLQIIKEHAKRIGALE
ncbi:cellulase family glycosylhydrolase [Balneola sp. MJW-20]|uniref:glycoside hydrolase 5 family protein n=1 Tax=Gracilimonas aurantiaca TaxID=3234185 RepID=UPI0034658519